MTEPTTKAGRALHRLPSTEVREAILAIEAEARAPLEARIAALEGALRNVLPLSRAFPLSDIDYPTASPEGKVRAARALLAATPAPPPPRPSRFTTCRCGRWYCPFCAAIHGAGEGCDNPGPETPTLDVKRLARAIYAADWSLGVAMFEELAEAIAREYAALAAGPQE